MNGQSKTKGIISFILITFGLAWGFWLVPLAFGLRLGNPFYQLVMIPGAFSPAIACLIVRKCITKEGFDDAGLGLKLRGNWKYYLTAWLLPVPVVATIILLAHVFGLGQPEFTLERMIRMLPGPAADAIRQIPPALRLLLIGVLQGLLASVIAMPLLWGEEFGWRSYLQIRLFADKPLKAAVVTGLIWGIWHYPINLQGYNYPNDRILGLFLFPVFTVLISIILGWLRLRTGSVWVPSLAHASTNAIGGGLTVLIFGQKTDWIWVSYAGFLALIPLGIICAWIVLTGRLRPKIGNSPA